MNSKTSLFSKSIFKSDIKRFWWLGLLNAGIIFTLVVMPVYNRCIEDIGITYYDSMYKKPNWDFGTFMIIILFAICTGILLFSYLHKARGVAGHHSLPVTRGQLYRTKLVSGAALLYTPIIINALLFVIMLGSDACSKCFGIGDILSWVAVGALYVWIVFSLTVFVNMMTGYSIGAVVFTVGFMILPLIITSASCVILEEELYGYCDNFSYVVTQYIYISEQNLLHMPYCMVYIVMGLLFLVGAYYLYKRRKLENYGEVIAVSWLKPVFIAIVGIFSSIMSYMYFAAYFDIEGIWYIIPLGVVGTVIAWMISRKSLSLKGVWKPIVIYIASALVVCGIIKLDVVGFEDRTPDLDRIDRVEIGGVVITDREQIADIVTFQEHMIATKNIDRKGWEYAYINYQYKDGGTMLRRYRWNREIDGEYAKADVWQPTDEPASTESVSE